MKIAVEILFDKETRQWCVGMVAAPWIASCGRTAAEAKKNFLEALQAYFDAPRKVKGTPAKSAGRIERLTVA